MQSNSENERDIAGMVVTQCFDTATTHPAAATSSQAGEEYTSCANIIDECVHYASTTSNPESQPPTSKSTQEKVSLTSSMKHSVRPEVLSSLPLRRRPPGRIGQKTTAVNSYATRSKTGSHELLARIGSCQATVSHATLPKIGSSKATASHETLPKIGSSKPTASHETLPKIGSSKPTASHETLPKIGSSKPTASHATLPKIGSSKATASHATLPKIGSSKTTRSRTNRSKVGADQAVVAKSSAATENAKLSKYQRQCVSIIQEGSDLHKIMFRGKEFYVVALAITSLQELDAFEYPSIEYRRMLSADHDKSFEDHIRETGPSDKFGTISVIHNKNLTGIIVDGKRRHQAYKMLIEEKTLAIGDLPPNTANSFRWHRDHLTIRLFVPVSLLPPTDAEILSLSVALNGDNTDSTPLSEADVYAMLQRFAIYYYGTKHKVPFFHNKANDLVQKAMSAKLLDHLLPRNTSHGNNTNAEVEEQVQASPSTQTSNRSNRKQIYSRYVRSSISFFNHIPAFDLVFNKFGVKCPLWCKELFCYDRFIEMDETEMTVSLALMAKRYMERRRKENFDMTVADAKKVIDLVMDMMHVVETVAKDKKALDNSSWSHWLGARLQHHKDKNVSKQPYIYSLAFFVYKWNEKTIWKKDLILKEIERDRLQWPPHRRWRGQKFELEEFNESFFRTEIQTRKQFEVKRKRKRQPAQSANKKRTKRQRIVQKRNLQDVESDDVYEEDEEDEEEDNVEDGGDQAANTQTGISTHQTEQVGNEPVQALAVTQNTNQDGKNPLEEPTPNTSKNLPESGNKPAEKDSTQLCNFMDFILRKAGVQHAPKIDVTSLLKADSSEFLDKIIHNLRQYGASTDQRKSIPAAESESEPEDQQEDEDKEILEKVKQTWATVEKQFKERSDCEDFLPEPCQGMGLWGRLLLPGIVVEIKEEVRMSIFRSRQARCSTDDDTNQLILNMFKEIRSMEIKYQGFTVCQSFLSNEGPKDWVDSFLSYYMQFFTGKDGIGKQRRGDQCPWESIANIGAEEDAEPLKKGVGRFQVSSIADVEYLTKNQLGLYRKKLMLEVFVAQLISSIITSTNSPLRFPCFGSKLLVHTADAKAQRVHCDYAVRRGEVLEETEVKYFAIVTGKKSSFLHALPMGHLEISRHGGKKISDIGSKLVEIPPYSIGIFRGDLPHAGAGADDDIARRGKFEFAPRMHFYIDRPQDKNSLVMEPSFLFYPQ